MLDEEELAFLVDSGIADGSADQTFTHNVVFQTDDLDAYDSDCDEIPSGAVILMTNLSSCDPETIFKVHYSDYAQNDVFTQSVHELQYSEQSQNVVYPDIELMSDKDIQCAGSDHDHYQEAACAHHAEHVMHDCIQLDHVVDSHNDYTSDSNIILCDQYGKDNEVPVIHSDLSYVLDDAFMMIYDDMKKMNDPECVTHKVMIAPHDYSKENLLATFTPQKQLTPEQIFWSNDLMKLKSEALNERTKVF
nr:retrovirus-related Pol polyprotein from transposon TNT 1-94 [Tanacetum cinerariifolium]